MGARCVFWTYYVDLIVFEFIIPFINIDDMISVVNSKSKTNNPIIYNLITLTHVAKVN